MQRNSAAHNSEVRGQRTPPFSRRTLAAWQQSDQTIRHSPSDWLQARRQSAGLCSCDYYYHHHYYYYYHHRYYYCCYRYYYYSCYCD